MALGGAPRGGARGRPLGAVGRRQAAVEAARRRLAFSGRGGEGRGRGTRGGEGRLGGSRRRARVRDGAAAVAAPLTPACLGGTLFVSHNALRGRQGWKGEGKWAGRTGSGEGRGAAGAGPGGGAQFGRKRRRSGSRLPRPELWVTRLRPHWAFRHRRCSPWRVCTRAVYMTCCRRPGCPVCLPPAAPSARSPRALTEAFLDTVHASCIFFLFKPHWN